MQEGNGNIYSVINFTFYDPVNSIFKTKADERNRYTVYECCDHEHCEAYANGKCIMMNGVFGDLCKCGKKHTHQGYTKKAKSYYKFLSDAKEKYKDYSYKLSNFKTIYEVGYNYIYIPMEYLTNYVNPIADELGIIHSHLIPKENFTVDNIDKLINFHPCALFGGEIKDYQKKELPEFVRQLKRKYPALYEAVKEKNPHIQDFVQDIDYVALKKKAYLKTLKAGKVGFSIYSVEWDGEKLIGEARAFGVFINGGGTIELKPNDKTIVEILDNATVDEDKTIFVE